MRQNVSLDSLVSTQTRLEESAEATNFGPLQTIQTGYGAHPTSTEWVLGVFPGNTAAIA